MSGDNRRFQDNLEVFLAAGTNGVGKSPREFWIAERVARGFGAGIPNPPAARIQFPVSGFKTRDQRKIGGRVGVVQLPTSFPIAHGRILPIFDPFFLGDRVNLYVVTQLGKQSKIPEVSKAPITTTGS